MIARLFDWVDRGIVRLENWVSGLHSCKWCGAGFVPRGTGQTKKRYCSIYCASNARSERRRKERSAMNGRYA